MKKLFALIMVMTMAFTACSGRQKEKYPPQKMDFGGGDYSWHYFDDNGQRIKYEVFKDDVLTEIHYSEYDEAGNEIRNITTDPEGNELVRTETTYENGKKTYQLRYRNGVMVMEEFYDDNENNYLSKYYDNGTLYSWTESFYNENNSATMSVGYRADGTVQWVNEYSKDENGNFVTNMSEFDENEELVKLVKRTNTKNGYKEEIIFEK